MKRILSILLVLILCLIFSCQDKKMIIFKPIIFENNHYVEINKTEPNFYNNLKLVLDYYKVEYLLKDSIIYVNNTIYEDKEMMMNYTLKANDKYWIKQNIK